MAYAQIEITEVGPPEHPLIRVLHDAVFPGADFAPLQRVVESQPDPLLLMAHLEGNPLGYLLASPGASALVVHSFGVLSDYRRAGVASRLLARALGAARMRQLAALEFRCDDPAGAALARSCGFDPHPSDPSLFVRSAR